MSVHDPQGISSDLPHSGDSPFLNSQNIDLNDRTFFRVTILAAFILLIYAAYNLVEANYVLAWIEALLCIMSFMITWLGSTGRMRLETIARLLSLCSLLFFSYLVVTGSALGTGLLWAVFFPFVIFFFNGLHLGLLWVIAFFLINALIFTVMLMQGEPLPFDHEILIRAAVAYCAVSAFAYYYEKQHFKYRFHIEQGKEKFERLIENSSDLIAVVDPAGEFLFLSASAERIIGYKPEEMIGMNAFDYIHEEDKDRVRRRLAQVFLHPGEVHKDTFRFLKKDGDWCILEAIGKASPDDHSVITAVANGRDITAQKKMEEHLLHTQKMEAVGTLVGGIAHDFNNTLAAMKGILFLAGEEAKENPRLIKRLNKLDELSAHAAGVVEQLLTFANKDLFRLEKYSLTRFMKNDLKLSESMIPENIRLTLDICDEDIVISGDPSQCQQAMINLLANAIDAVEGVSDPEISLTLEAFRADDAFLDKHPTLHVHEFAHVVVRDNGCGIAPKALPHIYEPFFTTKEVGKGTGLGLSMVYGAVTRHGGVVEAESTPGNGTAIHIYLPTKRKAREEAVPETMSNTTAGSGRNTILFVDDNSSLREVTCEALESIGYSVIAAADGREGMETYERHRDEIAIVVSDLIMPNMGGIELLNRVRKMEAGLPFVLVTGYDRDDNPELAGKLGNCRFLSKPFGLEQLTDAIGELTGLTHTHRR